MKYDTRRNLLKKHHLHSNGDHKGIVLTRTGITKSFYWNGITKDVENMVSITYHEMLIDRYIYTGIHKSNL